MALLRSLPLLLAFLLPVAGPAGGEGAFTSFPAGGDLHPHLSGAEVETYTIDTLWEKIDGEAEYFRLFGLIEASFARYAISGDPDSSLEIGVYRLPGALAAFGLFASYRSPGEILRPLGNGASWGDYQGYLWHGRHFVTVEAFGSPEFRSSAVPASLEKMAGLFGESPPPPALLLVMEGVAERDTIRFRPDHLLGREGLPPGLEGRSPGGDVVFLAAVAPGENALDLYGSFLEKARREKSGGVELLRGTDDEIGPVVMAASGDRLAGALPRRADEVPLSPLLELLGAKPPGGARGSP